MSWLDNARTWLAQNIGNIAKKAVETYVPAYGAYNSIQNIRQNISPYIQQQQQQDISQPPVVVRNIPQLGGQIQNFLNSPAPGWAQELNDTLYALSRMAAENKLAPKFDFAERLAEEGKPVKGLLAQIPQSALNIPSSVLSGIGQTQLDLRSGEIKNPSVALSDVGRAVGAGLDIATWATGLPKGGQLAMQGAKGLPVFPAMVQGAKTLGSLGAKFGLAYGLTTPFSEGRDKKITETLKSLPMSALQNTATGAVGGAIAGAGSVGAGRVLGGLYKYGRNILRQGTGELPAVTGIIPEKQKGLNMKNVFDEPAMKPMPKAIEPSVLQIKDVKTGKVEFKTIPQGELADYHSLIDDGEMGMAGRNIGGKIYHLTAKTPEQMQALGHTFSGEASLFDLPATVEKKVWESTIGMKKQYGGQPVDKTGMIPQSQTLHILDDIERKTGVSLKEVFGNKPYTKVEDISSDVLKYMKWYDGKLAKSQPLQGGKSPLIEEARKVKVYRGLEAGDKRTGIEAGNYVTTDKKLARYYAGKDGKILEMDVPANQLTAGETADEHFYTPDKASVERANRYFKNNPTIKQFKSQPLQGGVKTAVSKSSPLIEEARRIDERLAPLADKDGMVTMYRASSKFPTDKLPKDTFLATDPNNARYYAESHYRGNPSDITIKEFKIPASQLKRGGSTDAWQLIEDYPILSQPLQGGAEVELTGVGKNARVGKEGYQFYSPNVEENLNFETAQKQLNSPRQAWYKATTDEIDSKLGYKAESRSAIGDWSDGAENTIYAKITGVKNYDELRYSAALKGKAGNQKAVIPFIVKKGGPNMVHELDIPTQDIEGLRKALDNSGLQFRTLDKQKGAIKVLIFDEESSLLNNVNSLAKQYGVKAKTYRGQGEFLGSWDSRAEGLQKYEQVIQDFESRGGLNGARGEGRTGVSLSGNTEQAQTAIKDWKARGFASEKEALEFYNQPKGAALAPDEKTLTTPKQAFQDKSPVSEFSKNQTPGKVYDQNEATTLAGEALLRSEDSQKPDHAFQGIIRRWIGKQQAASTTGAQEAYTFKDISPDKAKEIISYLENPSSKASPEIQKTASEIKARFDYLWKLGKDAGVEMGYLQNYITHIWKESPAEIAKRFLAMGQKFKYANERVIPSYKEGIKLGLTPKYDNPAQILGEYAANMERIISNLETFKDLQKAGLVVDAAVAHKFPGDFAPIQIPGFPRSVSRIGADAKTVGSYYAPKEIVDQLNQISKKEINPVWHGLARFSRRAQDIVLSGGLPGTPANAWTFAMGLREGLAGRLASPTKSFFRALSPKASNKFFFENAGQIKKMQELGTSIQTSMNVSDMFPRSKVEKSFGKTIGHYWDKVINEPTFKRFYPQLQIRLFNDVEGQLLKGGYSTTEAAKIANKAVQNFYGVTDSLKIAKRSPIVQDATTTFFLAPRYRESIINFWVNNLKALKNPLSVENRMNTRFMVGAALAYAAYDYLNQKTMGKHLWENPSGKEDKLLIPLPDGNVIGVPYLSSIATLPRLAYRDINNLIQGNIKEAAWDTGQTLTSVALKPIFDIMANSNYYGGEVYPEQGTPGEKYSSIGRYALQQYSGHPWIRAALEKPGTPAYQRISEALEAPFRFYKGSSINSSDYYAIRDKAIAELKFTQNDVSNWESLHPTKKDMNGNVIFEAGPLSQQQRAILLLNNPKLFEAETLLNKRLAEKTGQPINPFYNLTTNQQKQVLKTDAMLPGEVKSTEKSLLYGQPWYKKYTTELNNFYDQLAQNKKLQAQTPEEQEAQSKQDTVSGYFDLKDQTSKNLYLKAHPEIADKVVKKNADELLGIQPTGATTSLTDTEKMAMGAIPDYEENDPSATKMKYAIFYQYPAVFNAKRENAFTQAGGDKSKIDPLYLAPQDLAMKFVNYMKQNPGSADAKQLKTMYPEIAELTKARSAYFEKNPLPGQTEKANQIEASPELQAKLDHYYTLPLGTGQRSAFIRANPDITAFWDALGARTNEQRLMMGLGPSTSGGSSFGGSKFGYSGKKKTKKVASRKVSVKLAGLKKPSFKLGKIKYAKAKKIKAIKVKANRGKRIRTVKAVLKKPRLT